MKFLPLFKAVNCVDTVDIFMYCKDMSVFLLECSGFWSSKISSGREGVGGRGGGSDLNV